ncbi:MAG: DUF5683 domain-containing protein [Hymenobacter sp.]
MRKQLSSYASDSPQCHPERPHLLPPQPRPVHSATAALGYGLQILDAVVDAHLHDFDVSDNLSLNWQPGCCRAGALVPAAGLALTLRAK